ncbi:MAG: hypothetical protein CMH32_06380 [Micavibrio sp.]|nr:hypothetical protein [Micavibrio sp.]
MDKNSFPKWFYELPMQVQHALQYREQNPYRNVQYISHLSPDEIREALLHPELNALRLYADPNDKEETEKEVLALLRHIAWETDTAVYTQLPEQLNHYKFVRHYGNKAMVVHWDYQTRMIYQSIAEFKNSHIDKFIAHWNPKTGQWERRPLVEVWLKDPRTPKYDSVEFLPGVEHEIDHPGILNSWRGWPCNTAYVDYSDNEPEACRLFLNHMYDNLCGGDADVYTYLLGWMADALINPHRTSEVAIVLRGAQGSGKTFWANRFMSLFTPHTLTLDKPNQVTGNFNKHLEDKCVVFADEAFFAGNHQHAATLKTLITSDEIFIEPKGVDGYMAKKLFRVIIASNDEHVIRAEIDDRRYLVLDVDAGAHNQDGAYFKAIAEEWDNGGKQALFHWLRGNSWKENIELGLWDVRKRPQTRALQRQKDLSLPETQAIIHQMLHDGELPELYSTKPDTDYVFVSTRLLAQRHRLKPKDETALGKDIRLLTDQNTESVRVYLGEGYNRKQYRGFWLPSLKVCRERWEDFLRRSVDWPDDVSSWSVEEDRIETPPF